MKIKLFLLLCSCFLMVGCSSENYAPVNNAWSQSEEPAGKYRVQQGETLYAIAWRYDMDYRTLAEINHLHSPYTLETGQILLLQGSSQESSKNRAVTKKVYAVKTAKIVKTTTPKKIQQTNNITHQGIQWQWPAAGQIISTYSPAAGKKGVDIAGTLGEPIVAAASGKVAYCGNGLRGYGNLIIIKHNDEFLSAYAHNQTLLVHEGQMVTAGQKIATMGNSESKRVMLHFEIREAGQSVNPLRYVRPSKDEK